MSDFSQEQVDQIVKERLDRAKTKHAEQIAAVRAEAKLAGAEITKLRERVAALEPYESQVGELRGQIESSNRRRLLSFLTSLGRQHAIEEQIRAHGGFRIQRGVSGRRPCRDRSSDREHDVALRHAERHVLSPIPRSADRRVDGPREARRPNAIPRSARVPYS